MRKTEEVIYCDTEGCKNRWLADTSQGQTCHLCGKDFCKIHTTSVEVTLSIRQHLRGSVPVRTLCSNCVDRLEFFCGKEPNKVKAALQHAALSAAATAQDEVIVSEFVQYLKGKSRGFATDE